MSRRDIKHWQQFQWRYLADVRQTGKVEESGTCRYPVAIRGSDQGQSSANDLPALVERQERLTDPSAGEITNVRLENIHRGKSTLFAREGERIPASTAHGIWLSPMNSTFSHWYTESYLCFMIFLAVAVKSPTLIGRFYPFFFPPCKRKKFRVLHDAKERERRRRARDGGSRHVTN